MTATRDCTAIITLPPSSRALCQECQVYAAGWKGRCGTRCLHQELYRDDLKECRLMEELEAYPVIIHIDLTRDDRGRGLCLYTSFHPPSPSKV
jgi:hypothetical protein